MNHAGFAADNFRRHARLFACPVCSSEMHVSEAPAQFCCSQGHSFDFARQGYLNLMLANQRNSLQAGYDMATLRARKTMLENGLFAPLIESLQQMTVNIARQKTQWQQLSLLDVGSGEGYLFAHLVEKLQSASGKEIAAVGSDISKPAMQIASQSSNTLLWCVANLMRRMPFADHAFHILLNILAPSNAEEFQRLLIPQGYLLKVLPLENHLVEIRRAIYEHERKESHNNEVAFAELSKHLQLITQENLSYLHTVGKDKTSELLHMSPLFWKGKKSRIEALLAQGIAEVTVHLSLSLWQVR